MSDKKVKVAVVPVQLRQREILRTNFIGRGVSDVFNDFERIRNPHAWICAEERNLAPRVDKIIPTHKLNDRATYRRFFAKAKKPDTSLVEGQQIK
jgi:hypothetical protein